MGLVCVTTSWFLVFVTDYTGDLGVAVRGM